MCALHLVAPISLEVLILVTHPLLPLNYVRYIFCLSLSLSCAQFPLFFLLPLLLLLNFFLFFPLSPTVQLYTYQRPFMLRFAQVSARLDIELLITQKKRREVSCIYIVCKHVQYQHVLWCLLRYEIYLLQAFSKAEGAAAKSQHEQLQKIHEVLRDATFYSL